jgi:O-antigen ligase
LAWPSGPSSWLFAASLAFAPLTSLRVPGFEHLSYCDVLFLAAVLAGILERFLAHDFIYKQSLFVAILFYILSVCALSASYGLNFSRGVTIEWQVQHGLGYNANFFSLILNVAIIPLALFAIRMRSLPEFRSVILIWAAAAIYGAAFVVGYCHGYISHYDWYWTHLGRARGLTPHPNVLGINTVMAVPVLLLFWCEVRDWVLRIFIGFGLLILWNAANLSGSRTTLGALVIVVAVFFVIRSKDRVRGVILGGGILLAAEGLREIIAHYAPDITRTSALGRFIFGAHHSNSVRDNLNSIALDQWLHNPVFGVGYGMSRVAHNLYLQMLDVSGLVGFLPWLCALLMPLIFLLANRTHEYARNEESALFSGIVMMLAVAWIQPSITDFNSSIVFGLALYLAVNPHFVSNSTIAVRSGQERKVRGLIFGR